MYSDETYRAYLLGTVDGETEAGVEEELLDGRTAPDRLRQLEEELIDDHLFGRLPMAEERLFQSRFLCSPDRLNKLQFARALKQYAVRSAITGTRHSLRTKLRVWTTMPWLIPLAGALGCVALTVMWLGERSRSLNLNQELAQVAHTNDEQRRTIASMVEEQHRRVVPSTAPASPSDSNLAATSSPKQSAPQTVLHVSPVSRGVPNTSSLHLNRHASTVTLILELPFDSTGTLREELLDDSDHMVWKQEFFAANGVASRGVTTIVLPAAILPNGRYRLNITTGGQTGDRDSVATYQFYIQKD